VLSRVLRERGQRVLIFGTFGDRPWEVLLFFLLKLLLLPLWLPFKLLSELIEHSGRRRRHRPVRTAAARSRPAVPVTPAMRQASRKRNMIAWLAIGVTGLGVVIATALGGGNTPAAAPAKPAAATVSLSPTQSPSPSPSPTRHRKARRHHHRPAPAVPVATRSAPAAAPSCYPLTNSGHCYEPGEFCRYSDEGATGVAGDGEKIKCEDNNGWRWEPI
jgi:hypothetical protein